MRWIVLVLIAPCLFAGEFSKIEVVRGKTEEVIVRWDVPPESCESKMYRWNGESLDCMTVDRSGILKSQRNLNMNAFRACKAEVTYLKNDIIVRAIHDDAREKCREFGKLFDKNTVQCAGSSRGETKQ